MKLMPCEKYELNAHRGVAELEASINKSCAEWSNSFSAGAAARPLVGSSNKNRFKVYRNISYRNSFLPIAVGHMHAGNGNALVSIKLRISFFAVSFMAFWFVGLLVVLFFALNKSNWSIVIGSVFLEFFGYCLMQVLFLIERDKLKGILSSVLLSPEASL